MKIEINPENQKSVLRLLFELQKEARKSPERNFPANAMTTWLKIQNACKPQKSLFSKIRKLLNIN